MRTVRCATALGAGIALLAAAGASGQERSYTYVPVGGFGADSEDWSGLQDVNESGVAVGSADSGGSLAIRWERGALSILRRPITEGRGSAIAINDAGDIAGWADVDRYEPGQPFLYRDGTLTSLGTGYGTGSSAAPTAINNGGAIVGSRRAGDGAAERGFLWRDGQYQDLGTLGGVDTIRYGTTTTAEDINDQGQIVGSSMPAKGPPLHAYIWEKTARCGTSAYSGRTPRPPRRSRSTTTARSSAPRKRPR